MSEQFPQEGFEISPRFRRSIQERIERLEHDADFDEERLLRLFDPDHVVRQRRLIAAQRAEALRMRIFLDRSATRIAAPPVKIDHPVI